MKKYIALIIVLTLIALWPFAKKGYFESHDGEWMVIRFSAFHQTLSAGQFPVRFVDRLNDNYGYPVLNFLYPLPFYISEISKILGFDFVNSIKITFVLATLTSTLAMFWALSQLFEKRASLAGSILYLFIPYRFVDLYVRGSLGESLAFAFIPLVAGSIFKISKGQMIYIPLLSVFLSLLILSHNVIAVLFLPFFFIASLILIKKSRLLILLPFLLSLLITAFFWFPAIYDLQFVKASQFKVSNISDHLVGFSKLIVPSWGYGPTPGGQNSLSVQLGIVPIFIVISAIFLRILGKTKNRFVEFQILLFFVVLILMTKVSLPFWQKVPLVDVVQFPWRLLSLIVFTSAFLTSYIIDSVPPKKTLVILIISASLVSTIVYTRPKTFVDRGDGFYATNEDSTTVAREYLPLWVKEKPTSRADVKIQLENSGQIISSNIRPAKYQAEIITGEQTKVWVDTIYFPGWKVKVDHQSVPIDYHNKYGLINFNLPQGKHQVIIKYARSPVHLASELISIVAILATGFYFSYFLWRKQNS